MNRDDIIRMAHDAGMTPISHVSTADVICSRTSLERFAALVAAAEREAIKWNSIHSCYADCQNPACVIVREAVAAEREACAKWCEAAMTDDLDDQAYYVCQNLAAAIRARGQE